jgi:D-lactate dehydrogenase
LSKLSGERIPRWNKYMPIGSGKINTQQKIAFTSERKVVYFPSCINRSMGVSAEYKSEKQLSETMLELLTKAGIEVIYPQQMDKLCCGMPFLSKGYTDAGMQKSSELEQALLQASENGKYPVLSDMSPCLYTMKENMKGNLKLYEPVSFILEFVLPFVEITPLNETISVFPVCSMKKMGLESGLKQLAEKCAREVIVIESNCCGFAGDRGFLVPELNKHGLRSMKNQLPAHVTKGFSTSRTCEIGLSQHSGVSHKSIVYLVNSVSIPKKTDLK